MNCTNFLNDSGRYMCKYICKCISVSTKDFECIVTSFPRKKTPGGTNGFYRRYFQKRQRASKLSFRK